MAGIRAAALLALVLTVAAPVRTGVTILGSPVSFPAGWLILAADAAAAGLTGLEQQWNGQWR